MNAKRILTLLLALILLLTATACGKKKPEENPATAEPAPAVTDTPAGDSAEKGNGPAAPAEGESTKGSGPAAPAEGEFPHWRCKEILHPLGKFPGSPLVTCLHS